MPAGNRISGFYIDRQMFNDIDQIVKDLQYSKVKFRAGMDMMVKLLAYYALGRAQYWSTGPRIAETFQKSALSYRMPVPRRTGAALVGWKAKREGMGMWSLSNETRDAWAIEYGINPRRERRPVLKQSLIDTLRFVQSTGVGNRFWPWVFASKHHPDTGQFVSFADRIIASTALKQLEAQGEMFVLPRSKK